jgi:mono/diheme cytochrome c family protein
MLHILHSCSKSLKTLSLGVLAVGSVLLAGYTDNQTIDSNYKDSLELGSFVETGFPYISTSVDARKLGPAFPQDNMAARTLALQLGDDAYVCFDTDLLRWSVAWTGKFLPMALMAQVSYKDFFNKNNKIASLTGDAKMATGLYPGWTLDKPFSGNSTEKNAERQPTWAPMPAELGRWKGVYVYGNQAVLNYSVGAADVAELPGNAKFEDQVAFTRAFQIGNVTKEIFLTAAEVRNAAGGEVKGKIAYLYQGVNKDTVTAVGIVGKGSGMQPEITGNQFLTVKVQASQSAVNESVVVWKGPVKWRKAFENYVKKAKVNFPDYKKGGPALWKETVVTKGKLSPDTAAFVTDQLTLPLPNPWKRNVRVADIAFFKDGRASVVTFEGDVWMIEGIDKNLQNVKWTRYASGFHEPMSIEIVKEAVYVFGREGIVKLHDLNHDGVADFYENFSNVMEQSAESREWAADMVTAPDGTFYIAKGGSLDNGPGMTSKTGKGFRSGSSQNGAILKISADGLKSEVIATGLRGPYLGMHPEKGILTASDQQGNFVPSTPIYWIKKGDYFGVQPTAHRSDNPEVAPPLTWIPHRVDRSSISQAWITGNKMGPLNGNLIHFSFGRPGLFRVLIDSVSSVIQGGVSVIHADYPAPTSKGTVNPIDGQLYVAGFNLWGSTSTGISALLRLRYTGKPSYMPNAFHAGKQGVILGFDTELDPKSAADPANFAIKRWNYQRTEEYGSGHFKMDGSSGEETMVAAASYLSADRKKILLLIPEMAEVMQMEVTYKLAAADGKKMNDSFWFTVNKAEEMNLKPYQFGNVDLALLSAKQPQAATAPAKEALASADRGREIFQKMACAGCHSEGLKTDGMYGPPFQNLYASKRLFTDGSSAIADDKYIRESILTPSVKIVKGYAEEMPSFVGILTDSDIESVTMYIKSLGKK